MSLGRVVMAIASLSFAVPCAAQITPAAGYTPPDDTPVIRVGATIFADYTVPADTEDQGRGRERRVVSNAFNVGRAYINITGNITHNIAFRITPDITRETGIAGTYHQRQLRLPAQICVRAVQSG